MYAPGVDELARPWSDLDVKADRFDKRLALDLRIDEFDTWTLTNLSAAPTAASGYCCMPDPVFHEEPAHA